MPTSQVKTQALQHLRRPVVLQELSRLRARELIIRDALAALVAGKIQAAHTYGLLRLSRSFQHTDKAIDAVGAIKSCEVCAKGALLTARLGRFNSAEIRQVGSVWLSQIDGDACMNLQSPTDTGGLEKWFSNDELDAIELVFESDYTEEPMPGMGREDQDRQKFVNMMVGVPKRDRGIFRRTLDVDGVDHSSWVLFAIFQNMLRNGTKFKPLDLRLPSTTDYLLRRTRV